MTSKTIVTILFVALLSLMMSIFVYFGNHNRDVSPIKPDWALVTSDADTIQFGFELYQKSCTKCHGANHEGTYSAPILNDDEWIYPTDRDSIFKIISDGTPNKTMRGWGTKLKTKDIQALTLYIMSLKKN
ncbi:hypothetical protein DID80_01025 [Candidatus Marinamargulisbacteria bacterium SCGC AAA071-K20]|nr:hypothetical protein DID80_01025 [Candidatus Marinamargulisbacteria bacterium SCGC AAA071-K20]